MIKDVGAGTGPFAGSLSPIGPGGVSGAGKGAAGVAGEDFGAVMGKMASEMVSSLEGAEAAAIGGIRGTVATPEVVEAILAAEQTLHTAVAVRDKAVAAYNELIHMAI